MNLVDAKICPGPLKFGTIRPGNPAFASEFEKMNPKVKAKNFVEDDIEIATMTLGTFPVSDESNSTLMAFSHDGHGVIARQSKKSTSKRSFFFAVPHRQRRSMRNTKHRLASLALDDIFGKGNVKDLFGLDEDGDSDAEASPLKRKTLAPSNAKSFVAGLLYTLETYTLGHCADFGWDYGKRLSPSPLELVAFLEDISGDGGLSQISFTDLVDPSGTSPPKDGLSCLAASPPQARHLVPEPYDILVRPENAPGFEELYGSCFDPLTMQFDLASFERRCQAQMQRLKSRQKDTDVGRKQVHQSTVTTTGGARHIMAPKKHWIILSKTRTPIKHPFQPPAPFSDRVKPLRKSNRIKATKLPVTTSRRNLQTQVDSDSNSTDNQTVGDDYNIRSVEFKQVYERE
mmetsp:Transcript_32656/g.74048  ORF Transcript_32656/g.74048 Transcript_32656/m.74048 type:complete len:401 (+) Transcript_32656:1203-2405(+)